VQNKGPTIPPEQLARMFQGMKPQLSGDERDRRHLGLGLYIVDKIVGSHGGRMLVRSQDTEGTTFVLRVPRTAESTP
jgi:signal transduction histidine kinase